MSDDKLLTRRQILSIFGGATGAAIVGTTQADLDGQSQGSLIGGAANVAELYQVGPGLWKGPLSVRSDVPKEDGHDFIQTDAGPDNDMFAIHHYNGGWDKQGFSATSVSTEQAHITDTVETPLRQIPTNYDHRVIDEYPSPGGYSLENFDDASEWSVADLTASAASISDEPDDTFGSSHAIRANCPNGSRLEMEKSFSSPVNLSEVDLSVGIKPVTFDTSTTDMLFYLYDSSGNEMRFSTRLLGTLDGFWFRRALSISRDGDWGTVDPTDITDLKIRIHDTSGDKDFIFDDLRVHERADTGRVIFRFDDSHISHYEIGYEILRDAGFPAVLFVHPGEIGGSDALTWDMTDEMHEHGSLISNHTMTFDRVNGLPEDDQREEIVEAKRMLQRRGYGHGPEIIGAPGSEWDQQAFEIAAETHKASFFSGVNPNRGVYTAGGVNATTRHLMNTGVSDSEADAKQAIDDAAEWGQVTWVGWHDLTGDETAFQNVVDYAKEKVAAGEIKVTTPPELFGWVN